MSLTWRRRLPLSPPPGGERDELWEVSEDGGPPVALPVRVRIGKPFDVVALKGLDPEGHRAEAARARADAAALYGDGEAPPLTECPCCGAPAAGAPEAAVINGVAYHRCPGCGHGYVRRRPERAALARHHSDDEGLAGAYTDPAAIEARLAQVVMPKLDWARGVHVAERGREPVSAIDIGAGGGHFVLGARRAGLAAAGIEVSGPAVRFAREALGVDLRQGDALTMQPEPGSADLVTLWGVLEYAPDPFELLRAAARWLAADTGLLVIEVPRLDAISSAVQRELPGEVFRHLEPASHLHAFSDASLATLLWRAGLRPVAAWYFGMDAYELLSQLAVRLGGPAIEALAEPLLGLQADLDAALAVDDLVVAAVPR